MILLNKRNSLHFSLSQLCKGKSETIAIHIENREVLERTVI